MADLRIDLAAEFKGKKAFKEADSAVSALDKSVSKLGKKLASVFAAQKIYAFGKASVKAFAEDQASAARLAKTVDNLGLSFANPAIDLFIKKLEMQSGIVDENLRPAFQAFLTTTGDVSKSMTLLTQAIDISRGSGIDLATVTQDLSNGYVGITKGLKKYNLGLSQTQLKTMGFAQVMVALNKQFSGASANYLDTYAGKMDILNVAADNAKETIGSGLVDAFKTLTGNTGITNLSDTVGKLATNIADFFRGLAIGFRDLANMPVIKQLLQLTELGLQLIGKVAGVVINPFVDAGKASRSKGYGDYAGSTAEYKRLQDQKAADKAKAAADAKAASLAKSMLANQKQLSAEQAKQAALKKDSGIFDMQQIELIAALKGQLSDDDRRRAELQLALLNGNVTEADKLTKQILMAQDSTGNLYKYFMSIGDMSIKNPFAYLDKWILDFQSKLDALKFPVPTAAAAATTSGSYTPAGLAPALAAIGVIAGYGATIPQTGDISNVASTTLGNGSLGIQTGIGNFVDSSSATGSGTNVKVYVQGNVVTEQDLIDAIQRGLQTNSLSGSPSAIGRIAGMFG